MLHCRETSNLKRNNKDNFGLYLEAWKQNGSTNIHKGYYWINQQLVTCLINNPEITFIKICMRRNPFCQSKSLYTKSIPEYLYIACLRANDIPTGFVQFCNILIEHLVDLTRPLNIEHQIYDQNRASTTRIEHLRPESSI